MRSYILDKDTVTQRIESAFPLDVIPEEVLGSECTQDDARNIVNDIFKGTRWTSITRTVFRLKNFDHPTELLSKLNDTAFIYYLPSYLLMVVDDIDAGNIKPESSILSGLYPYLINNSTTPAKYKDILSDTQKAAIASVFKYGERARLQIISPLCEELLNEYWGEFLPPPKTQIKAIPCC